MGQPKTQAIQRLKVFALYYIFYRWIAGFYLTVAEGTQALQLQRKTKTREILTQWNRTICKGTE